MLRAWYASIHTGVAQNALLIAAPGGRWSAARCGCGRRPRHAPATSPTCSPASSWSGRWLRDVGQQLRMAQQAANDMERLIEYHRTPATVVDRPDAAPLAVAGGAIRFERVRFHYGDHAEPLFDDLSVDDRRGRAGGAGRPLRQRQDDLRQAPAAAARDPGRAHPDRRPGHRRRHPGEPARGDRPGAAGAGPVPPLARREHRLRPARAPSHERDRAGGAARPRPRLHRAAAAGLRHPGRRARRQAVGRRAPAGRDRPRHPGRPADPGPGRGDLLARQRGRAADPGRARAPDGRTHHAW